LIVGVDSVTFRLLKPLVGTGELPALGRLMGEGAQGVLLSSIPSVTPPGWTTSYTGVNPAKHNVYDFKDHTKYLEGEMKYEMGSVTSQSIKADPFWRVLNTEGLTVGMVNAPMVYPVEEMDGHATAGFPCPTEGAGLFYPPELEEEIKQVVPDYMFFGNPEYLDQDKPAKYIERINQISADRARAAVHLIGSRPTDVVVMVFTEVDRVQHFFWNTWDEGHPTHDAEKARFRNAIPDTYKVIDRGLADLMEAVGPEVPVLVYSDHGAAPVTRHLYPNTYLIHEGLMVLKDRSSGPGVGGKRGVKESRLDRHRIERAMKRMGIDGIINKIPKSIRRIFPVYNFEKVDWSTTKAYFSSASAQTFTINLRGREPEGWIEPGREYDEAVEEVIGVLERLRDPDTDKCPFASIHRRQDLWEGPYLDNGPDIITVPAEGYVAHKDMKDHVFDDVGQGWRDRSSDHEREGVVILYGRGIRRGVEMNAHHIEDLAPTILHMCGAGVPRYMDGKVIEEAFEEDWLLKNPVRYTGDGTFVATEKDGPSMTMEEEELLKERLRGLGYLG